MLKQSAIAAACAAMLALTSGFTVPQVAGSPDVNLSPKRIVVADGDRSGQEVLVFNRGTAAATYSVTLVDRRMTSDGQLDAVDAGADPGAPDMSAASMIRYSPRRVTLEPGQSQVVRLQIRRPATLPDGEYRSHLTVSALPPTDAGLTIEEAATASAGDNIQVRITPVYGVSIPVIVRQGALTAEVGIARVAMPADGGGLEIQFTRSGSRSAYGDVVARAGGPDGAVIAELRGVGIYPEITGRSVTVPLAAGAAALKPGDVVHVSLIDRDASVGSVLAAATTTL